MCISVLPVSAQLIQKGLLEDTNNNQKTNKVVPQVRADKP